jgi:uncharacterized protein (UPF0335 family)
MPYTIPQTAQAASYIAARALTVAVGQLAEALDEVERLRGVVERLQVEKHHLAEELLRRGSDPS